MFDKFQIIGHRGWAAKYPENTILGFDKAIKAGATMIEFDIHLTHDNHLAVIHDASTTRTCNDNVLISSSTRNGIKQLRINKEHEIPFLDEVFDQFNTNVNYYIELKTYDTMHEESKVNLAFYTVNEIMKHSLRNNCIVVSFDKDMLRLCRRAGFNNVGINYNSGKKPYNSKLGCINHKSIKSEVTEPTYAWTVNNAKRMKTLLKYKVNGIVTDHVDKLVNICNDQLILADV